MFRLGLHTSMQNIKKLIFSLSLMSTLSYANDFDLPDLGTPSDSVLSPIKEKEIRDEIVNQIYAFDLVMSDPLIADYIEQLGYRIAAQSENPSSPFDFFMVNQNVVNASAYPGGLIIIFSGLFIKSDSESELAGVVAHEIAHVTQRHMSRAYANSKKTIIPTILGMVGAAMASRYVKSRDAPIAMAVATQAMSRQSMINFTRAHEAESDRVAIANLKRAGFNPMGMATFFEKLMREAPSDERYQLPEYSRTHPLSINRVSEAKNRAKISEGDVFNESDLYPLIKERVRVFTKHLEIDNVGYYRKLYSDNNNEITNAQTYGYALALYHSNQPQEALNILQKVERTSNTMLLISILEANIWGEIDRKKGLNMFEGFYDRYSDSPIVIEPYIQLLSRSKNPEGYKKARRLARKLVQLYPENANYYQLLAVVNQNLGKSIEANEALAMKEHLVHNNYKSVRILKNILKNELDYYQRARIESKISTYESLITDKERSKELQEEKTGRSRH